MPSSFMVKRNYAHCPLKKRPLALYNEPASPPEQDEPEDLSVKRPRLSSPSPTPPASFIATDVKRSASSPATLLTPATNYPQFHSAPRLQPIAPVPLHPEQLPPQRYCYDTSGYYYGVSPSSVPLAEQVPKVESSFAPQHSNIKKPEKLPSLAEYYLQLFRSTSEAEAKRNEQASRRLSWQSSTYLPPSPQTSPVTQDSYGNSDAASLPTPPPQYYTTSPLPSYPDTSALISPVSTCSSAASESEEELGAFQSITHQKKTVKHTCESCGKSYSTQSGLRKHNELHCSSLGPRAFACKHCSKAYTSVGALKMHIRTHTLPCKCHVCGKAFSRPWLLQGHIRTHTGEKPFECQQCHRSFADRSNLRAHQQTHQRVKKYACRVCNKTFSRMSLLNKHTENVCVVDKSSSNPVHI